MMHAFFILVPLLPRVSAQIGNGFRLGEEIVNEDRGVAMPPDYRPDVLALLKNMGQNVGTFKSVVSQAVGDTFGDIDAVYKPIRSSLEGSLSDSAQSKASAAVKTAEDIGKPINWIEETLYNRLMKQKEMQDEVQEALRLIKSGREGGLKPYAQGVDFNKIPNYVDSAARRVSRQVGKLMPFFAGVDRLFGKLADNTQYMQRYRDRVRDKLKAGTRKIVSKIGRMRLYDTEMKTLYKSAYKDILKKMKPTLKFVLKFNGKGIPKAARKFLKEIGRSTNKSIANGTRSAKRLAQKEGLVMKDFSRTAKVLAKEFGKDLRTSDKLVLERLTNAGQRIDTSIRGTKEKFEETTKRSADVADTITKGVSLVGRDLVDVETSERKSLSEMKSDESGIAAAAGAEVEGLQASARSSLEEEEVKEDPDFGLYENAVKNTNETIQTNIAKTKGKMKNELMKNKGNIQKNDEGLNKVNESDVMAEAELKEFEKEEAGVGDPQEIRDRETASLAHHRDLSSAKSDELNGRLSNVIAAISQERAATENNIQATLPYSQGLVDRLPQLPSRFEQQADAFQATLESDIEKIVPGVVEAKKKMAGSLTRTLNAVGGVENRASASRKALFNTRQSLGPLLQNARLGGRAIVAQTQRSTRNDLGAAGDRLKRIDRTLSGFQRSLPSEISSVMNVATNEALKKYFAPISSRLADTSSEVNAGVEATHSGLFGEKLPSAQKSLLENFKRNIEEDRKRIGATSLSREDFERALNAAYTGALATLTQKEEAAAASVSAAGADAQGELGPLKQGGRRQVSDLTTQSGIALQRYGQEKQGEAGMLKNSATRDTASIIEAERQGTLAAARAAGRFDRIDASEKETAEETHGQYLYAREQGEEAIARAGALSDPKQFDGYGSGAVAAGERATAASKKLGSEGAAALARDSGVIDSSEAVVVTEAGAAQAGTQVANGKLTGAEHSSQNAMEQADTGLEDTVSRIKGDQSLDPDNAEDETRDADRVEHRLSSVRKDSQGEAGVIQDKTTTALAKQDAAEAQQVANAETKTFAEGQGAIGKANGAGQEAQTSAIELEDDIKRAKDEEARENRGMKAFEDGAKGAQKKRERSASEMPALVHRNLLVQTSSVTENMAQLLKGVIKFEGYLEEELKSQTTRETTRDRFLAKARSDVEETMNSEHVQKLMELRRYDRMVSEMKDAIAWTLDWGTRHNTAFTAFQAEVAKGLVKLAEMQNNTEATVGAESNALDSTIANGISGESSYAGNLTAAAVNSMNGMAANGANGIAGDINSALNRQTAFDTTENAALDGLENSVSADEDAEGSANNAIGKTAQDLDEEKLEAQNVAKQVEEQSKAAAKEQFDQAAAESKANLNKAQELAKQLDNIPQSGASQTSYWSGFLEVGSRGGTSLHELFKRRHEALRSRMHALQAALLQQSR